MRYHDRRRRRCQPGQRAAADVAASARTAAARDTTSTICTVGRIGHVRGLEAKLRELELEDPANEAVPRSCERWSSTSN